MPKKRFNLKKLNPFKKDSAEVHENVSVKKDSVVEQAPAKKSGAEEIIQAPPPKVDSFVEEEHRDAVGQTDRTAQVQETIPDQQLDVSAFDDYVPFKITVVNKDYSYRYDFGTLVKEMPKYDGSEEIDVSKYKPTFKTHKRVVVKQEAPAQKSDPIAEQEHSQEILPEELPVQEEPVVQKAESIGKIKKAHTENVTFHFPYEEKKIVEEPAYKGFEKFVCPKLDLDKLDDFTIPEGFVATVPHKEQIPVEPYTKRVNQSEKGWMLWYIVFCAFIISWSKLVYDRHFSSTFNSIINGQTSNRLFREKNAFSVRVSLVLNFASFSVIGLFIFQILHYNGIKPLGASGFFAVFLLTALLILLYIGKSFLFLALGFITDKIKLSSEYIHNVFIYNKVLGIILFPVTILIPFFKKDFLDEKTLIVIGITAVVLFYLARIIRGALLCLRSNVSIFYLFLYLCMLELAPMLVLYKSVLVAS